MKLPMFDGSIESLVHMRDAISEELLGGDTSRRLVIGRYEDMSDPPGNPQAWTDLSLGVDAPVIGLANDVRGELNTGMLSRSSAISIAHELVHHVGEGMAYELLEDQLLEEVLAELVAQLYADDFFRAFGLEPGELTPFVVRIVQNGEDLELARPTAVGVALERFARLVAWIEDLDNDPGTTDDELEQALVKWVVRLKATPGEDRIRLIADELAYEGGDHDDVGAADYLEQWLRGYLSARRRSSFGFAAIDIALARAWGDQEDAPDPVNVNPWLEPLEKIAGFAYEGWGRSAVDTAPPELTAIARRTCDMIPLLWSARSIGAASRAP